MRFFTLPPWGESEPGVGPLLVIKWGHCELTHSTRMLYRLSMSLGSIRRMQDRWMTEQSRPPPLARRTRGTYAGQVRTPVETSSCVCGADEESSGSNPCLGGLDAQSTFFSISQYSSDRAHRSQPHRHWSSPPSVLCGAIWHDDATHWIVAFPALDTSAATPHGPLSSPSGLCPPESHAIQSLWQLDVRARGATALRSRRKLVRLSGRVLIVVYRYIAALKRTD